MNLSAPFIGRPIATSLLAAGLALFGAVAFNLLPVAPLPQVEFPTIMVQAGLPGASPEVMATSVATPLERQLGRIAGITEMTSTSSLGSTSITVQFDLSRDIDGAARDVQAAINAARGNLPANLPNNPTYRKVNPADAPIMIIALTSDTYTRGQMYDIASTYLQQRLAQTAGVGQVTVGGGALPAVRAEVNPTALSKYGLGLEAVRLALFAQNANRPKGQLEDGPRTYALYANDQLFKAYQYQPIIIGYRNGAPVQLQDVASVTDSVEDVHNLGLANGKQAVLLIVFKQPGANVIDTVDQIRALLPMFEESIPAGIDLSVTMDRTTTIRASLHDVEMTLLSAIALVLFVVYAFLGSARATLIPSVAVPLSLLGTFAAMYFLDYSLDNLSMMALTISTGFVVDDAIVVLENIERHIEAGMKPMQAALRGSREVSFTVVSMSLSLIAVFIPILLMGGIVGRLFHEFAVTLSMAILVSLVVSLTVTPVMCSRLLRARDEEKPSRFGARLFERLRDGYGRSLGWALRHPGLLLLLTLATVALNAYLYLRVPKGFFPLQDTGRLNATIQAQQDISFTQMAQKLEAYMKLVREDPSVEAVSGSVGGRTSNSGSMFISLKPLAERKEDASAVINRLRRKLAVVPGATLYLQASQDLVIGGRQGPAQFQFTLAADSLTELNTWAPLVMTRMQQLPGIADINSDQLNHGLEAYVTVDHDTAARFGITPQQVDNVLYDAFGQRQVSTMYTDRNQYHVVMVVDRRFWQRPESLNDIYVVTQSGQQVPLSAFAHFAPASTLLSVNHQGQFPSATLSFNLLPGVALGTAVDEVNAAVHQMGLPANVRGRFTGTAQAFQASLATEPLLISAALLAVYIVLGILYESTLHPITILSTLPSAGVGALLALMLCGLELSIIALIGIILLIGIVKKNAIMMIDFAIEVERSEGVSPREAIHRAAQLRLRPILMTTMAALLGALPLALGTGVGSELRKPLGIAIVGGLTVSQLLNLYTTPVIYLTLDRFGLWVRRHRARLFPGRASTRPTER
ncbi:multidrug efflux RND transporter permease subunit [Vitiosangium sp. GDMCC 1.1324]|uniref:multidrug efflux RND transporter permease subunit n=1 Tax=Vitiosangium sp. (strain GDMCC 1.1324) TaxID=2138576 RepID=UPI000D38DF89|nr:multidrug efflux RND transporter permease subunit [Vitiosangium sp. GDMCC 1.1324]PTL84710.1 multidrug transporter subunit MdtC [Vitiosangium sp. GDMCC 1.1324]